MRYKIDRDLLEKGIEEGVKSKINNLELKMEEGNKTDTAVAVSEYLEIQRIAQSFLINIRRYENIFLEKEKKLNEEFGIYIK